MEMLSMNIANRLKNPKTRPVSVTPKLIKSVEISHAPANFLARATVGTLLYVSSVS